jgi:hypothetical protein
MTETELEKLIKRAIISTLREHHRLNQSNRSSRYLFRQVLVQHWHDRLRKRRRPLRSKNVHPPGDEFHSSSHIKAKIKT